MTDTKKPRNESLKRTRKTAVGSPGKHPPKTRPGKKTLPPPTGCELKYEGLKILFMEDDVDDAVLIKEMLAEVEGDSCFHITWKDRLDDGIKEICRVDKHPFDLIILDLNMPPSIGLNTLNTVMEGCRDIPVVVVTGLDDETIGKEAIRRGAQDYLIKGKINDFILKRVIVHAIERFKILKEKERLIKELKTAQEDIQVLSGLIPICASCKKIRDDQGYWHQVETYISRRSRADFSHSLCPECTSTLYPNLK